MDWHSKIKIAKGDICNAHQPLYIPRLGVSDELKPSQYFDSTQQLFPFAHEDNLSDTDLKTLDSNGFMTVANQFRICRWLNDTCVLAGAELWKEFKDSMLFKHHSPFNLPEFADYAAKVQEFICESEDVRAIQNEAKSAKAISGFQTGLCAQVQELRQSQKELRQSHITLTQRVSDLTTLVTSLIVHGQHVSGPSYGNFGVQATGTVPHVVAALDQLNHPIVHSQPATASIASELTQLSQAVATELTPVLPATPEETYISVNATEAAKWASLPETWWLDIAEWNKRRHLYARPKGGVLQDMTKKRANYKLKTVCQIESGFPPLSIESLQLGNFTKVAAQISAPNEKGEKIGIYRLVHRVWSTARPGSPHPPFEWLEKHVPTSLERLPHTQAAVVARFKRVYAFVLEKYSNIGECDETKFEAADADPSLDYGQLQAMFDKFIRKSRDEQKGGRPRKKTKS